MQTLLDPGSSKDYVSQFVADYANGIGKATQNTNTTEDEELLLNGYQPPEAAVQNQELVMPGGSNKLRLLTLNLFLRPLFITSEGKDHKDERLQKFIDHYLANFDVICFQEVFSWNCPWKEKIIHAAQKVGIAYHVLSPKPWFYEPYFCDGGLLIISRLPIEAGEFNCFKYPSLLADATCSKGLLYAKIDLSQIGGTYLHLFNTHLQATESDVVTEVHVQTYVTRYEQIKEIRSTIKRLVFDETSGGNFDKDNDLVILAGDFNQNATQPLNYIQKRNLEVIRQDQKYDPILPLFTNEYKSMLNALKNNSSQKDDARKIVASKNHDGNSRFQLSDDMQQSFNTEEE